MPTISAASPHVRDILEPTLNKQARSAYLERQMKEMKSVKLTSDISSLGDGVIPGLESLSSRVQNYCQ